MATLKTITKNSILALSALLATTLNSSASAMTLSGGVEERDQLQNQSQPQSPVTTNKSEGVFSAIQPSASDLNPNTFPQSYQGDWACQTQVTDSTVSTVSAGQTIDLEVTFYPTTDGRVQARWNQAGWVETQNTAYSYGKNEAKSDRTTYYFGENSQGSWAARSRDQFAQTGSDTISASSYVDQYIDGQYVGRYRTTSVLKRLSSNPTIANR